MTLQLRHAWLLSVLVLAFGCDDGEDPPPVDMTVDTGGDGGSGGGMGGMGGEPADLGADTAVECVCERGVCDEDGVCIDAEPCAEDVECLDGNICENGACVEGCTNDGECAMADPATPVCVEGRCGDCRSDDDCFGTGTCVMARCEEPAMCLDTRECAGDRACVDGACGAAPDCNADVTCPGGWTCLPSGDCAPVRDGACGDDDDCGPGLSCLDAEPAYCGACRDDGDCPGSTTCTRGPTGNRCTEGPDCLTDDDCLGVRICDAGACVQPACDDDGDEPNDTLETATPIGAGFAVGRVSCNPDYYRFELPADTTAEVILRQLDRGADLTLVVLGENGNEAARSQTNEANEAVTLGPFAAARPLFVRVEQAGPPAVASYSLEIRLFDEDDRCVDDRYDVAGDDDTRQTGRRVRNPGQAGFTGDLSGRICPDDTDVFCFQINAREQLSARVEVLSGDAVIAGEVTGADGAPIANATATWSRDEEPAELTARGAAGTWCLHLTSDNGGASTYRVALSAVSTEAQALCRLAAPLQLNGGTAEVTDELEDESAASPLCVAAGGADGGEKVFTITVDDPDVPGCAQNPCLYPPFLLTARVEGVAGGTLGDPVVSLRRTCADGASEMACADDTPDPRDPIRAQINPSVIRVPVTEPGEHALIVDGIAVGNSADFTLQVIAENLPNPPPNETCADAPLIDLLGGVAEVPANLVNATDDHAACLGDGGPDVAYRIQLDRRSYVRVQALAQPNDFAVAAYLVADCGAPAPVGCGYGFEGEVPPGEYFLVLDGADANARGRVTAQIVVEPFGNAPQNDTCESAQQLAAGGGELQGDTRSAGDDYQLEEGNACTQHNTRGGDVVYVLPQQAAGRYFIEAIPQGGWDLALAVVGGCDDPAGQRRACSDGALTESVVFDAPGSQLYVIVDGTNGEHGRFTLRWGPADCAGDFDCDPGETCRNYACVAPAP